MPRHDYERLRHLTERDLLLLLIEGLETMALDLTTLTNAVAKVSTDVDTLLAAHATAATQQAADQAQVDALVPAVTAISAKVTAALPAPTPAA